MAARRQPRKKGGTRGKKASPFKRTILGLLVFIFGILGVSGLQYYRAPEGTPFTEVLRAGVLTVSDALGDVPLANPSNRDTSGEFLIARVDRVVDGDTLVVTVSGREERIRLLNIDTPESVHPDRSKNHPLGTVASDFVRSQLERRQVRLQIDAKQPRDRYGRMLAVVIVEGENFNERLIREGFTPYETQYGKSPWYDGAYRTAEREARAASKGIWASGYEALR